MSSPLAKALLLYAYVAAAFVVFFKNWHDAEFKRATLRYFVQITVAFCLLQYGSGYSMRLDFSRWHWGDDFALFPVSTSSWAPGSGQMSKYNPLYWCFMVLSTSLYMTFPQAVVNGSKQNFRFKKPLKILSGAYGVGVGFLALVCTVSSLVAPYPCQNWFIMLLALVFIVGMLGTDFMDDVRGGMQYVPDGDHVVTAFNTVMSVVRWWKKI